MPLPPEAVVREPVEALRQERAQAPPAGPAGASGAGRGGRGMAMPKKGVCPLPILPALKADTDTAFYAKTDVPHGRVEAVNYKNYKGVDTRMQIL